MGACSAELDIKKANRNMDALYSLTRSVVTKGAMMVGGCILAAAMTSATSSAGRHSQALSPNKTIGRSINIGFFSIAA